MELSEEQEQYKQAQMDAGLMFEGLIRSEGWKLIKTYYEDQVKAFATRILTSDADIEEFEKGRWELQGMRKLFAYVDSCIRTLEDEKNTGVTE